MIHRAVFMRLLLVAEPLGTPTRLVRVRHACFHQGAFIGYLDPSGLVITHDGTRSRKVIGMTNPVRMRP